MQQKMQTKEFSKIDKICFSTFGLNFGIQSEEQKFLPLIKERLPEILIQNFKDIEAEDIDFEFLIKKTKNGLYRVSRNRELLPSEDKREEFFMDFFLNQIRLTIAEFAVSKVFIHAGVVGWKGKGIIIPALSYSGKTTMVSELIKKGAEYYSDEYAVLDENGLVHPFPKSLSVRGIIGDFVQKEITAEEFGAATGSEPIPVELILFTEYSKDGKWEPKTISKGQGILEILTHTLPIRVNTEFTLEVLKKTMNGAKIIKTDRGEAPEIVNLIFELVEN